MERFLYALRRYPLSDGSCSAADDDSPNDLPAGTINGGIELAVSHMLSERIQEVEHLRASGRWVLVGQHC